MKYCESCRTTYPTEFTICPKDQNALRDAAELTPGMVLRGKYEVLEKIGTGGMATVYRVRHVHLQEDVALKVVSSKLLAEPQFVDRFRTEAVITRKLRHPNAVRLDDFDTTEDGRPFIVMELVEGQSLRQLLQSKGWLSVERAAGIARQAALALDAAHRLGIIHRDVKPENILLIAQPDGSDLVKVLDFGIAKLSKSPGQDSAHTQTGIILGTPQYLSPEQARASRTIQVDGRADLYALGVVLFEMLTGRVPFTAENPFDLLRHHIQTPPTAPHLTNPGLNISTAMSDLVLKALEKDAARRFQTGEEMAQALADPNILVSAEPCAQVFSTAALAAAAMADAPPAEPAPAAPVEDAILPPLALQQVEATLQSLGPRTGSAPLTRTILMGSVTRTDTPSPVAAAAPLPPKSRFGRRSRVALAAALAVLLIAVGIAVFGGDGSTGRVYAETTEASPVASPATKSSTERAAVTPTRSASEPSAWPNSRSAAARGKGKGRGPKGKNSGQRTVSSQELTNDGYLRMQRGDYAGAEAAFSQALEIDPSNDSARKGLQAARTAQTVQGVARVLGR